MQFSPILATWPSGSVLSKLSMTLTSQADLNPISQGDIFVPFSVMWPSRYIFSEMSVTLTSKIVNKCSSKTFLCRNFDRLALVFLAFGMVWQMLSRHF